MKLLSNRMIGRVRRFLFTRTPSKWNAWVRDVTAWFG